MGETKVFNIKMPETVFYNKTKVSDDEQEGIRAMVLFTTSVKMKSRICASSS